MPFFTISAKEGRPGTPPQPCCTCGGWKLVDLASAKFLETEAQKVRKPVKGSPKSMYLNYHQPLNIAIYKLENEAIHHKKKSVSNGSDKDMNKFSEKLDDENQTCTMQR
jgi:hypothetical protein